MKRGGESRTRRFSRRARPATSPPEPPLPAVAGGRVPFRARYLASALITLFVPSMLRQARRQAAGDLRAAPRAVCDPAAYDQKMRYSLPFAGEWYVYNGGVSEATSHSWNIVAQRYAYDFVVADEALRRWREGTRGERHEDYLCYGAPVLAPGDGVVVRVRDGVRDAPGVGTGWVDPFAADFRGNFVVVRHAVDEYSFLAHLIPRSVPVKEGERVERGQRIGLCGNSGHSTEPHMHFHVQDRADFFEAAGLPVAFDGVSVDGEAPASGRYPERGTRVRQEVWP